ncbi:MAG TPA: nucleoside diphosphate kinase regulator [Bacteroidales bacterium]|nr:nucleoside diphosphate kinase regulator [Bacteroidales bacterium]
MSELIINSVDLLRIKQCLNQAKQSKTISAGEATKLLHELSTAKVLKPEKIPANVVTMNSIVEISFTGNTKHVTFQIVYPQQANVAENKISIFSSIATALIGYKVGDEIDWIVPAGPTKITIEKIHFQPESEGKYSM